MNNLFDKLETREAFLLTLTCLQNITNCVVEDYPITDEVSNYQFSQQFITKTRFKNLRSNLRGNVNYLKRLTKTGKIDIKVIAKKRKKLSEWHDFITQKHMFFYSRNLTHSWNYYGIALHYLIDAYYHILTRFAVTSNKPICFWCRESLHKRWSKILTDIMENHLIKIYIYLSLAQNCSTDNKEINMKLISKYFSDIGFLIRKTIK